MLRGLTTVSFWADDVSAARDWYTDVLGIEPYFQRPEQGPPAYIEFRVGADEDDAVGEPVADVSAVAHAPHVSSGVGGNLAVQRVRRRIR